MFQPRNEYHSVRTLRFAYIFIVSFLVLLLFAAVWFMYRHVYNAIDEANNVILLKSELGIETIDFNRLERVRNEESDRENVVHLPLGRDPFITPEKTEVIAAPQI